MLEQTEVLKLLKKPLPTKVREGRKGAIYTYIPTRYVSDRLTDVFGLNWSFEIKGTYIEKDHVAVLGRLVYPLGDGSLGFKEHFGGTKYEDSVGLGDSLKKSASLALKKAASLIGIDLQDEEDTPVSDEQRAKILTLVKKVDANATTEKIEEMISGMNYAQAEEVISTLEKNVA